jgi:hypothetical protein
MAKIFQACMFLQQLMRIAGLRCTRKPIQMRDAAVIASRGHCRLTGLATARVSEIRSLDFCQQRKDLYGALFTFPRRLSSSGIYSRRRFTEVLPAMPPGAGTGRTFIPLILPRPAC